MSKMRVVQVFQPNGPFELVERDIPEPGCGSVRIRVEACGICHGDSLTKDGTFPGIRYPRAPGHEVAGIIDLVGEGVPDGPRASGSRSAGTADIVATAILAAAAISVLAESPVRRPALLTTADTRTT